MAINATVVAVSYDPTQNPAWTFDPDPVTIIGGLNSIIFAMDDNPQLGQLAGFTATPWVADFSWSVDCTLNQLVLVDNDADPNTYNYTISLVLSDGSIVSSDPQIINKPGT